MNSFNLFNIHTSNEDVVMTDKNAKQTAKWEAEIARLEKQRTTALLRSRLEQLREEAKAGFVIPILPFRSVGDKVWLNAKNIRSKRSFKKLDYKYHGPFEIIKLIDKRFYKLKLFDFINKIHNVFHVFLLEPYKKNNDSNNESLPIEIEGDTEWKIEKILNNWIYHN